MQKLIELYKQWSGEEPQNVQQLTAGGSNREYYRMTSSEGKSVVGCVGTSRDENHAFIYLAKHFTDCKLPVPTILAVSNDELRYIQTDLGSMSLFDAIRGGREAGGRYTLKEQELLRRTIRELPKIQIVGADGLDFDDDPQGFLYRDFQARNVMLNSEGRPYFIDFQGGRKGPYYYDLASFLWQASAKYPYKVRRELVYEYYNAMKQFAEVPSPHHFVDRLSLFVLFRQLQVLGAYGFRGYFERKLHFIESIPPAMQNIRELLDERNFPYPYLTDILRQLTEMPRFQQVQTAVSRADGYKTTDKNPYKQHPQDGPATFSKYDAQGPLVVRVFSFSYTKGIPEDESGNGGGYVFDCRSTHNPGRYEPYKQLTGLDEPVIRFLEDDGEILTFLDSVYKLADAHVRRYIQRGFTSLMFCFGCTGGQHRSVYSAQHLAEHIHEKFGIEVRICHREQKITQTLSAG